MGNLIAGTAFLRAESLMKNGRWGRITYTIKAAHKPGTFRSADGKPIEKVVLEFEETPQRMIVGKLNERLIRYAVGETKWAAIVGKPITLHASAGNWFGQQNVAALRVVIPDGQYKPFLSATSLGKDITGKGFAVCQPSPESPPPSEPAPSAKLTMDQQVDAAPDAARLEALLASWRKARPVGEHAETWGKVLETTRKKVTEKKWPASDSLASLDMLISEITAEVETSPPKPAAPDPAPAVPIGLDDAIKYIIGAADRLALLDLESRINVSPDLSEADIAALTERIAERKRRIDVEAEAAEPSPF